MALKLLAVFVRELAIVHVSMPSVVICLKIDGHFKIERSIKNPVHACEFYCFSANLDLVESLLFWEKSRL